MSKSFILLLIFSSPAWLLAEENSAEVHVGTTLTRGNSETLVTNAGFSQEHHEEDHVLTLEVEGNYGESTTEAKGRSTTVQNAKLESNYRHDLHGSWYAVVTGQAFHDDLAKLNYRTTIGPGLGSRLVDTEQERLIVELGTVWVREAYRGPPPPKSHGSFFAFRLGQEYRLKLSENSSIWQNLEVLPTTDELKRVLATAEIGARAQMNTHMSLRVVVQNRYISEPPEGREENDLSLIAGVGYSF